MKKIIIAAVAKNGVIAGDYAITSKINKEYSHFREVTEGYFIAPLRYKVNSLIIFSGGTYRQPGGRIDVGWLQLKEGIQRLEFHYMSLGLGKELPKQKIFFMSGKAEAYAQAIPICDEMLISRIRNGTYIPRIGDEYTYKGDTLFPGFDESQFTKEIIKEKKEFYVQRYTRI